MYRKEKSKIAHGWSMLRPDGSFLCWLSDAAVANELVKELNMWRDRANAAKIQSSNQILAGSPQGMSTLADRNRSSGS